MTPGIVLKQLWRFSGPKSGTFSNGQISHLNQANGACISISEDKTESKKPLKLKMAALPTCQNISREDAQCLVMSSSQRLQAVLIAVDLYRCDVSQLYNLVKNCLPLEISSIFADVTLNGLRSSFKI